MFMIEPSIIKFITYLKSTEKKYGNLISCFEEKNEEIFKEFPLLSQVLTDANLNVVEILHVLSFVIVNNQKIIDKKQATMVEEEQIIKLNTIAYKCFQLFQKGYEQGAVQEMISTLEKLGISKVQCEDLKKLLNRIFQNVVIKDEDQEIIQKVCTCLEERKKEVENIVLKIASREVAININGYIARRIPKESGGEEARKRLTVALDEEYQLLNDTITFLKTDKNILQKRKCIYVTFDSLIEDLELLKFKKREIMITLFQIIKKNIAISTFAKTKTDVNYTAVLQYDWKHFELSELREYFENKNENRAEIINVNKKQIKEILAFKKHCYEILTRIISSTIILDAFYFSNKECTLSDIEKVYQGLMSMNIPENICEYIKYQLIKDLKERDKIEKSEQSKEVVKPQTVTKETKKYLTDQEYKELRKKVKEYFDFYHMKLLKEEIAYEEIMECAKNAHLLGIEDSTIELFFRKAGLKEKQNIYDLETQSIAYYISVFDKLQFYSEKLGISTLLKDLNECLQNMMITNQKNYIEFKQLFEEYLSELPDLKEDYKYELSLIKNENKDRKNL